MVSVTDMSDNPQSISAQQIKDYIYDYYETNPMLEYVLLVGDVNGSFYCSILLLIHIMKRILMLQIILTHFLEKMCMMQIFCR